MILVAGGTGRLGSRLVELLRARALPVRVLTRDPTRAQAVFNERVEVVAGDLRAADSLAAAVSGVRTVVSAVHGFAGPREVNPRTVDFHGNANLIYAAEAAGVDHFVLISIVGAAPDHPMELMRMKHRAEEELRSSALSWTIVRATAFMELWTELLGRPLLQKGQTTLFGRGDNPINFVSVEDVALCAEQAVTDNRLRGMAVDVAGPENLRVNEVVEVLRAVAGKMGTVRHIPLPLMRVMSVLMQPFNPALARQIQGAVVMDRSDMTADPAERRRWFPSIPLTRLEAVARREVARSELSPR
jgi:uncharacterized protein YbjT (DUF2867 family)